MTTFRRFEMVEGTSRKFWEIAREGDAVITRFGRIGTSGQESSKSAGDEAKAIAMHDKLVREKTGKGYAEVGASASSSSSAAGDAVEGDKAAVAASTSLFRKGQRLVFEVADFDAQDAAHVTVDAADENGVTVKIVSAGSKTTVKATAAALASARKLVRVAQGSVYAGGSEVGKAPLTDALPFLLSRASYAELAQGKTELVGTEGTQTITLSARRKVRAHVDGKPVELPILEANGDENELIVLDDPLWPIVLVHRWSGDCFAEIRGIGAKLKLGQDDEMPELPDFSTWSETGAAAAPVSASPELVALLGRAVDAFEQKEQPPGFPYWDGAAMRALVDEAIAGPMKRDAGAKALAALVKVQKYDTPFVSYGAPEMLRACMLVSASTGLPAAAEALIRERGWRQYVCVRPTGDVERALDAVGNVTLAVDRVLAFGPSKSKWSLAAWSAHDGALIGRLDVVDDSAYTRVLADGSMVAVARRQVLRGSIGDKKPKAGATITEPAALGYATIDPTGRWLADVQTESHPDARRSIVVSIVDLATGARVALVDLGGGEAAVCAFAGAEIVVATDVEIAVVTLDGAVARRVDLPGYKSSVEVFPDGRRACILANGKTLIVDLTSLAIVGQLAREARIVDDTTLWFRETRATELIGLDGAMKARSYGTDNAFPLPGGLLLTSTSGQKTNEIRLWRLNEPAQP